jgi:2-oxoisovalerate dehydrogenase E1 component beta subunit
MIQQAISGNDPVVFFEPKSRYWPKGEVDTTGAPRPLHQAEVIREGTDITLIGHGAMVSTLAGGRRGPQRVREQALRW